MLALERPKYFVKDPTFFEFERQPFPLPEPRRSKLLPPRPVATKDHTDVNIFCDELRDALNLVNWTLLQPRWGKSEVLRIVNFTGGTDILVHHTNDRGTFIWHYHWRKPIDSNCRGMKGEIAYFKRPISEENENFIYMNHRNTSEFGWEGGYEPWFA